MFYALGRVVQRALVPFRSAKYAKRTAPFIHRGARGLLFELYPGEYVDRTIAEFGIYEDKLLHFFESIIPSGGTVLDVGANIGNHALYLSSKAGVVHCFEPNPRAYRRLERNIALNKRSNIKVHRYGLGDRDAKLRFHDNHEGNLGGSRFTADGESVLRIRKGDAALRLERIDFIKIDVEGMEAAVIDGLSATIRTHRPVIAFEFDGKTPWRADRLPGYAIYEPVFRKLSRRARLIPVEPEGFHPCLVAIPET